MASGSGSEVLAGSLVWCGTIINVCVRDIQSWNTTINW